MIAIMQEMVKLRNEAQLQRVNIKRWRLTEAQAMEIAARYTVPSRNVSDTYDGIKSGKTTVLGYPCEVRP